MKNFRAAAIGLSLFVVFAIGVTTLVYGTLRRDTTGSTKNYTAIFTDVTGVRVGDDVRIAGVRVGRVDSIELDGSLAKLKFRVKSNQNLYGNTIVAVTYQNIIGQRYISLSRGIEGSPERLPEGSVIPVERTEPSFDVGALLNGFEPLFTLLDPKQVDNLSNGLIDAFAGDRGALAHVVAQTTEITKSFAGRDQSLGGPWRRPRSAEMSGRWAARSSASSSARRWAVMPAPRSSCSLARWPAEPRSRSAVTSRRPMRPNLIRRSSTRAREADDEELPGRGYRAVVIRRVRHRRDNPGVRHPAPRHHRVDQELHRDLHRCHWCAGGRRCAHRGCAGGTC
ncbi:Putative Mce family protein [Mycobacteroides abscessus subsp. abscessus]|nr:Putative Mce family protein [Mycobacteroides abscessus subsp. abscessus]